MADSTNKQSKNRNNHPDRDMDTLLDEAESPIDTQGGFRNDDEAAIDRLLMDAGFDDDETARPTIDDDTVFSNEFDEFGDDFDLADISTDVRSTTEIKPAELKADQDFPLDLIDAIEFPHEDEPEDFAVENGGKALADEPGKTDEAAAALDYSGLADAIEEFSGFDEFNDFTDFLQPETRENNSPDPETPIATDSVESELAESEPLASESALEGLIVDVAEPGQQSPTVEYDEFVDEFDDFFNSTPAAAAADTVAENPSAASTNFDITADLEQELPAEPAQAAVPEISSEPTEAAASTALTGHSPEPSADNAGLLADTGGIAALLQFKSDQEAINTRAKKQISEVEKNTQKSAIFTYIALGLGIASMLAAIILGVMLYGAKRDSALFTERLAALEQNAAAIAAKNLTPAPQNTTAGQPALNLGETANPLPEQKNASAEADKHEPSLAPAAHEAKENVALAPHDAKQTGSVVAVPVTGRPTPTPEKPHGTIETEHHETSQAANLTREPEHKADEHVKEHAIPAVKKPSEPPPVAAKEHALSATPKPKPEVVPKPKAPKELRPKVVNKKKAPAQTAEPIESKKPQKPVQADANWSVNLIAYRQQWYANSKAAEFARKGVPVETIPVTIDNVTWYRLRVGGFNSKAEADIYAGRVKRALNLHSVWVDKK